MTEPFRNSIVAVLVCLFGMGCDSDQTTLFIDSGHAAADSLEVSILFTNERIAAVPVRDTSLTVALTEPVVALARLTLGDESYLTILEPNSKKRFVLDSAGVSVQGSLPDSLINYLFRSNNEFIGEHLDVISSTGDAQAIADLFEQLRTDRQEVIDAKRADLSEAVYELLTYQNAARAYSFLFYYGRRMKDLPSDHPFFGFITRIDNENVWVKSLPHNVLYRYEIEYLNERGEISDVESFLRYMEKQTPSSDLAEFLKAIYLSEVMSAPFYWERHVGLFNTEAVKQALRDEQENPYRAVIEDAASSFLSSQSGQQAFDFRGTDTKGRVVHLSDFKGRLVFINVWATWCVPCLAKRPALVQLAERFGKDDRIAFLAISVDETEDVWREFRAGRSDDDFPFELIIPDGMSQTFGERYNVQSIPRYILVDENGEIIDANLPLRVADMEQRIVTELVNSG